MKHYKIFGPLSFVSTTYFNSKFDIENDQAEIIIDFKESRINELGCYRL